MATDIAQELAVIRSQSGGETVKSAIVSALNKIAPTRGENIRLEFDHGLMLEAPEGMFGLFDIGPFGEWFSQPTLFFTFTAVKTSGNGYGQMAEIYFYDSEMNRLMPTVVGLETNAVTSWASEVVTKIADNDINTKWCWQWTNPTTLAMSFASDIRPAYISYVTANDIEDRDPVTFTVQYLHGATSKTILTVENATITSSRKTETQKFECLWS